jgi:AcrR family transcriptional regulator
MPWTAVGTESDEGEVTTEAGDRRLTPQGEERKQQLLDHATQLFAERGYAETRVIDIVRAAGVAKGLFYWYFDNKEAVFRELVESARLQMRRAQAAAIDPDANPLVRIRQGAEASILFMREQRRLYSMFDFESLDPKLTQLLRRGGDVHARDTARLVTEGIAQGLVRDDDPMLLAWGVVGIVSSYGQLYRTGRLGDVPVADVMRFTGRFVVRSLAASDEVAREAEGDPGRGRLRTSAAHTTPNAATPAPAR